MAEAPQKKIRVVLVDDSPTFRAALTQALESDAEIQVIGQAADGQAGVELVEKLKPDVVTMDVVMPRLDGIAAAKQILERWPTPILLMSTLARSDEQRMALNALRLGVVDVTNKPILVGAGAPESIARVIHLVKVAAHISIPRALTAPAKTEPAIQLIAVAASTGGPPALERVLGGLPDKSPPVVIAQHLSASFSRGFADWLSGCVHRPVIIVGERLRLRLDSIYIAGEDQHICVNDGGFVAPVAAAVGQLAPDANLLFQSVAQAYRERALGIVLTGMGRDGAVGLKAMRTAGAWTIGQDAASSIVYGMPQAAHESDALCEVLALDAIGPRLLTLLGKHKGRP